VPDGSMTVNDECEQVIMAYFKILFQHLPWETVENRKKCLACTVGKSPHTTIHKKTRDVMLKAIHNNN